MIRVGTCKYSGSKRFDPEYEGFESILVLMKSHSKWGVLGPYILRNEKDQIFENWYQFHKIYDPVITTTQRYSRFDSTVIWEQNSEVHWTGETATEEYWEWRKRGKNNRYAVRYPNSFDGKNNVVGSLVKTGDNEYELIDYIESRKRLYCKEYARLVKKEPLFQKLKDKLQEKNLLIIEVDGPKNPEFYRKKYGRDVIENDTVLLTEDNIKMFLNEPKYSFGHGFCLGCILLGKEEWMT